MKAIKYVCCVLVLVCFVNAVQTENSRSKIDRQLFDAFATDESSKSKRPFCNAFTGCGKKRNFQENPINFQGNMEGDVNIRLPLSVYKVLLRAASQNIRNTINRESNEYEFSGIPRVYLSGKMPLRKRFDDPSTSFE
ncbi:cardioactive peptide isoform X2 [Megachile rotundata]|uniref:cardioactive peptide isoform X2 n=1 Tax=Megachile rotundata TaxID=143995 RepID=UPI000258F7A9|nr:PREDICTED: cardioactive peptide-like isoform X1 [Megachile rotundata]